MPWAGWMDGAPGILHDGWVVGVSSSVRVATRGGKECGLTKEKRKMRRAEEEAERNPIPSPTKKERDTAKEASLSPCNDIRRNVILKREILRHWTHDWRLD